MAMPAQPRRRRERKPRRREVRRAQRETARGRPVTVTTTEPQQPQPGMLNIDGTAVYSSGQGPVMPYSYVSDQGGYPQQYADQMATETDQASPV
jgi:hypothetical protein